MDRGGNTLAHIPMKGDPPSLNQILEKYGDPLDQLAEMHFDCLKRAVQFDEAGDLKEANQFRKLAEQCRKNLMKYGFLLKIIGDGAKAVRW